MHHGMFRKNAGWGVVIYQKNDELQHVAFGYEKAEDPFHAVAQALLQTLKLHQAMHDRQSDSVQVFSDCKQLVQVVSNNTMGDLPS